MTKTKVAYPVGLTVKDVRMMTIDEMTNEGWEESYGGFPVVIEFNDGSKIYASSDPEGNDAGCIYGVTKDGQEIIVSPLDDGMVAESK
jgi:hypothetical protein